MLLSLATAHNKPDFLRKQGNIFMRISATKLLRGTANAIALLALPVVLILVSAIVGAYPVSVSSIWSAILHPLLPSIAVPDQQAYILLTQVRFPRILAAALVGSGLAIAGCVFQAIFRNPLSSPYTLGVSNGAGFGAALGILIGGSAWLVQISAVVWALIAIALTFALSSRSHGSTVTLLLSGMLVGSLFASLVSLIKFVADPYEKLPQIIFWLMGSLSTVSLSQVLSIIPLYLLALALIFGLRWRLTVLSFDEDFARSFGVDTRRDLALSVVAASALAAAVVSIAGIVGWIGVVVPHFARMLVGADLRKVLPTSISLGASFMLLIDLIARSAGAVEIPIGVLTGIVGIPLFLWLIHRGKVRFL